MNSRRPVLRRVLTLALVAGSTSPLGAQVVNNIQSFGNRVSVGDPLTAAFDGVEGPKGVATADFNGDGKPDLAAGNLDGTITVLMGQGNGQFAAPQHIRTGADELRAVLAVDLNGDGKPDIATASPLDGKLIVYFNNGAGGFDDAVNLPAWTGVRNLATGDFDGDGIRDLAAAGPGLGVRHYRGTGGGNFEILGDLPRLSPLSSELPRPVYALRAIRSLDGLRDDLLVTHAESPVLWVLSTAPANRSTEPPINTALLPAWRNLPSPIVISEVQINNGSTLRDSDGEFPPWVELLNKSAAPVDLSGWALGDSGSDWTLPALTIDPGRSKVVFLSGKNRTGPELHASIYLQGGQFLILKDPGETEAHRLTIPQHTVSNVSLGLAMDVNAVHWFDLPSPGVSNNAGFANLADARTDDGITSLQIVPRNPAPGESVQVTLAAPQFQTDRLIKNVWFSTNGGLSEKHTLLHRVAPGVYRETLPAGTFTGAMPHRVLARIITSSGGVYTTEIHPGLDDQTLSQQAASHPGRLQPVASVPSPKVKAFELGTVTQAMGAGVVPDLVYADDACGLLRVYRGKATAQRFEFMPSQDMQVRGAPRDVKLADTDGDGWLDATIVLRTLDLALSCRNDAGRLKAVGELPTGHSPREVVMADFSGDGHPDAAVINRTSSDISILTSAPGLPGLVSLDQIYPVDGEVAGLTVQDFNADGRADVMQLHRASGDISVRHANPDGSLGPATFIAVRGERPSGMATADVNNDGLMDTVTANLGGNISVQLKQADGTYDSSHSINGVGGMFAISVADFDNDSKLDLVAGLFDCRVTFFKGDGTGNFTVTRSLPFAYESRVMVTADFDQDGDIDLAGAGYAGNTVVIENKGSLHTGLFVRTDYPAPAQSYYGTERIGLENINGDSDPDLVIGSGRGAMIYLGGPGMTFNYNAIISNSTPSFSVSDVITLDLDGNGTLEMVMSCREAACVNILTQAGPGAPFALLSQADVPSGRYLAKGDIDGDGKPDLVGTGDVLWTVLSSRPPQIAPPGSTETTRMGTSGVLINEILSRNTGTPVSSDAGRKTDFVEIYNSTLATVSLDGWKLRVQSTQDGASFDGTFALPGGIQLPSKRHTVILFSDALTNPAYSGFNLPAEPGTITLLQPDETVADQTQVPAALENVSWSRFRDGHPTFRADGIPSPGMSNLDNGTVPPEVKLTAPSPATMVPGQPLTFTAKGKDDSGIISLSLLWQPVGVAATEPQRVILYDDGMHEDMASVDGFFAGQLAPGLPAGTEVQFYLEATDLSGNTVRIPDSAELTGPGQAPVAWTFSLTDPLPLAITEVATDSGNLVRDESGGYPDYVKIRNNGASPVSMNGVLLSKSPLSSVASTFAFPAALTLAPGEVATVFADGDPSEGAMHAPFTLDAAGDDLALLSATPSGARQWIHSLSVPPMTSNRRLVPLPGSGRWAAQESPGAPFSGMSYDETGNAVPTAWVQTKVGYNYRLEGLTPMPGGPDVYLTIETFAGDGTARTFTGTGGTYSGLRIITMPPQAVVQIGQVIPNGNVGMIYGSAGPDVNTLTVYYGSADAGPTHLGWDAQLDNVAATPSFAGTFPARDPGTTIYYRVRAVNGSPPTWSAPGVFTIPPAGTPVFNSLQIAALLPEAAVLSTAWPATQPVPQNMTFVYGPQDRFDNIAAWPNSMAAQNTNGTYTASLTGLQRTTTYYGRFIATMPGGGVIVSAPRVVFRTTGEIENMQQNLLVTEIMYNPLPPGPSEAAAGFDTNDFEYLELFNGSTDPMDLSGVWFGGIDFDFPVTGAPVLAPGAYAVIATNPHAFAARYGAGIPLAGWTLHPFRTARLSNSGETLQLHAQDGTLLSEVAYNDTAGGDDGGGFSLEYRPGAVPGMNNTQNWKAGRVTGGTPGSDAVPAADLTLTAWRNLVFSPAQIADDAISGPAADPDGDGLLNFQEYLFGLSPHQPDPGDQVQITSGPDHFGNDSILLTFPVNVRALNGKVIVESSTSGSQWASRMEPFRNGLLPADHWKTSSPSADGRQLLLTVPIPFNPAAPRLLYRLRMSSN